MTRRALILAAGLLCALGGGRGHASPREAAELPNFARIGPIRVGVDRVADAETRLGKGLVVTGGHPFGMRVWRDRATGWYFGVDGFDYPGDLPSNSVVIDTAWVSLDADWCRRAPAAGVHFFQLDVWRGLALNMTRREVLRVLRSRARLSANKAGALVLTASGRSRVSAGTIYTRWRAELTFRKDRLSGLTIECW